jgi:hypothetical protein
MKHLNQKATQVFLKLVEGLNDVGDSKKIDNSTGFMAVHVEIIGKPDCEHITAGWIVSVAHYYEQHGDLVCDPDCTFLFTKGNVFPMTFEQGGVIYQVAAKLEEGKILFNSKVQKDLVTFCNGWMLNIQEQQGL